MTKVKVIDFDRTETVYEAKGRPEEYGHAGTHLRFETTSGIQVIISPASVSRIEVEELCSKIEQKTKGQSNV